MVRSINKYLNASTSSKEIKSAHALRVGTVKLFLLEIRKLTYAFDRVTRGLRFDSH